MQVVYKRTKTKIDFYCYDYSKFAQSTDGSRTIKDKILLLSRLDHPSHNDKSRKVFSLPVIDVGLSVLLPEDRANEYETYSDIQGVTES